MSIVLIILFSIILSVGGFLMRRDYKKSNNESNKLFGQLFFFGGFLVLVIGIAHSFLHKTAWTDDRKQLFLHILNASVAIYVISMSILYGLKSKKDNNTIGLAIWSSIALLVLISAGTLFSTISTMNDGWTRQNEADFLNNCQPVCPSCDSNATMELMDCDCQLKYTKQYFPNPEEYNNAKSDEKSMNEYNQFLKKNCNVCDQKYLKKNTNEVEIPDDF